MVDDVKISETQPYASNILTSYNRVPSTYFGGTSYRIIPLEQISSNAYFFGGIVENVGFNTLDSMRVMAEINAEGFSTESYGVSIPSASKDTLFVNEGFTPTNTGQYTASILAKDDYDNTITDTLTQSFSVSEFIYARDNGDNTTNFGRFGINSDGSRQYGNIFDIFTTSTLYSIRFRLDETTTPNAQGTVRVNSVDPTSGEVSYLTETETINFGEFTGEWIDVSFDPPLILDAGQVILPTLFATYNGTDTVFISTAGNNPNNGESLVQDIDGIQEGVNPGTWLYTTTAACLRLNFDPSIVGVNVGINENETLSKFIIFPNPNNGQFNIQIKTSEKEELNVVIRNVVGQTVYSDKVSVINSLNKSLDLSHFKKGIYTISLEDNSSIFTTKKITIQ
jgi:hypothetical protein